MLSHTICQEEKTSCPVISFNLSKYLSIFRSVDAFQLSLLYDFHSPLFNCAGQCFDFIATLSVLFSTFAHDSCLFFFYPFTFKGHSHSAVITFTVIPHRIQNMSLVRSVKLSVVFGRFWRCVSSSGSECEAAVPLWCSSCTGCSAWSVLSFL